MSHRLDSDDIIRLAAEINAKRHGVDVMYAAPEVIMESLPSTQAKSVIQAIVQRINEAFVEDTDG